MKVLECIADKGQMINADDTQKRTKQLTGPQPSWRISDPHDL